MQKLFMHFQMMIIWSYEVYENTYTCEDRIVYADVILMKRKVT